MTLSWLFLEVAAWMHLCQVPGTWLVGRRVLRLSAELPRLSPLAAAIFTVMAAAVVLVLVVLGVLIGSNPTEVLTTHLGLGLCAFLGSFWFLRLLIQLWYYYRRPWPRHALGKLSHAALVGIFATQAVGYLGAWWMA
jgi:hypothetical protein